MLYIWGEKNRPAFGRADTILPNAFGHFEEGPVGANSKVFCKQSKTFLTSSFTAWLGTPAVQGRTA